MWGSVPVRDTAPLSLTLVINPLGRWQLDSVRVVATRSGKIFTMRSAWACGAGEEQMAKKRLEM